MAICGSRVEVLTPPTLPQKPFIYQILAKVLLSETFYRVYQQGQLRDEDPDEIQEYMEWSGWYEIYQDRRQRYEQAVEQHLNELTTPASLLDLHISQLRVPA
jgi:hypothetical protein